MLTIALPTGDPVDLELVPLRNLKGTRLPGSNLLQGTGAGYAIAIQDYFQSVFSLSYRSIEISGKLHLDLTEHSSSVRIEYVLSGELIWYDEFGDQRRLLAGQYLVSRNRVMKRVVRKKCAWFTAFINADMFTENMVEESVMPYGVHHVSLDIKDQILGLLNNPYNAGMRNLMYDSAVNKLLMLLSNAPEQLLPDKMTKEEVAIIHHADALIAENIGEHLSIHTIARMVGTNAFTLKRGFKAVFNMGVFKRLTSRRLDLARQYLENTDIPIGDIFMQVGYQSAAGFITAFRRKFNKTPREWRVDHRTKQKGDSS